LKAELGKSTGDYILLTALRAGIVAELTAPGQRDKDMRKGLIAAGASGTTRKASEDWLDLHELARVEVTSEHHDYPLESALSFAQGPGWRAGEEGAQTIRLIFDEPQRLKRIWLRFVERETERTQEFTLRWSPSQGYPLEQIVRQQWNFSPHGSICETEDYEVDLNKVAMLELTIHPDLSSRGAVATLACLRLA
jgi:hypothetical protein